MAPPSIHADVLLLFATHALVEVSERPESSISLQMLNAFVFQNSRLGEEVGIIGKSTIRTNDDRIIFLCKREQGSAILEDDFTKDISTLGICGVSI